MSAAEVPTLTLQPGTTWAQVREPLHRLLDEGRGRVVVATSGSTGEPKRVLLSAAALRASGEATYQVLDGPGRWLLALPTHHVAGLQVLARSALAGTEPVALDPSTSFTAEALAEGVSRLGADTPRYASLVPTQLHRALADDHGRGGVGADALRRLDAVLLGGAAADPALLERAQAAGVRVVTTYGMSETCGGCVYDGTPLPEVRVRITPEGRIQLGGPVLADGYLGERGPALTAERFLTEGEERWFVTDDRGVCRAGRLTVLGRLDDVIVTGGHKVEPTDVEQALRALPQVADALVLGVPDAEWGQRVSALVVLVDGAEPAALQPPLRAALPPHAVPRQVEPVERIPLLESGKPDRAAARDLLSRGGRMDLDQP